MPNGVRRWTLLFLFTALFLHTRRRKKFAFSNVHASISFLFFISGSCICIKSNQKYASFAQARRLHTLLRGALTLKNILRPRKAGFNNFDIEKLQFLNKSFFSMLDNTLVRGDPTMTSLDKTNNFLYMHATD